jgi:hydroxyacid-oxoacid transhydrogenase
VINMAKLINLYTYYPKANFMDFINALLGKGLPITKKLLPLITIPIIVGTGSETIGTAIFNLISHQMKTRITYRVLKLILGIYDPLNIRIMPSAVYASSSLDMLCHSLKL